jgi:hypothetical protein
MARKYGLPAFLVGTVTREQYERWLHRKAVAHVRRDRKRGNATATNEAYKIAIHRAASRTSSERSSVASRRPSISAFNASRVRSDAGILSIGVLLR